MKKTINGIEYELVKEEHNCKGCSFNPTPNEPYIFNQCKLFWTDFSCVEDIPMIWKEVKDDSASKDV